LVNVDPLVIHLATHEAGVVFHRKALGIHASYWDCLGREVLLRDVCEDLQEPSLIESSTDIKPYPSFDPNKGNHVENNALWLPAEYKVDQGRWDWKWEFMKLDTGACNTGVPSEIFCSLDRGRIKERMFVGITGSQIKRYSDGIFIRHEGKEVEIPVAFEYNKFLLGYNWFRHYDIRINLSNKPPFDCTPLEINE